MGWLGWGEEQTLNTSIPAIMTAYEGRMDMLKAIFGSSDDAPTPMAQVSTRPMSGQLFDAVFG